MIKRLLIVVAAVLVAVQLEVALPVDASARVRPGFYGAKDGLELVYFRVRGNQVLGFHAVMVLGCRNIESGDYYNLTFIISGSEVPAILINRSRVAIGEFEHTYAMRTANVIVNINFRRARPGALIDINAPHRGAGLEDCGGSMYFNLRRGRR